MEPSHIPHILLFPLPAKGHIKPFLCLAELLAGAGLHVTFLNTEYNHRRFDNRHVIASRFPTLHFESISDGLPIDQPRDLLDPALYVSMPVVTKPLFRQLLLSCEEGDRLPVTCIVSDVIFSFPVEVAEELDIPVYSFCPFSARYLFIYFSIPKLLEDGQLPYPDDGGLDREINGVPEAEGFLKGRDFPGFWSVKEVAENDPMVHVNQTLASVRSSGLILNSFEDLEAPFLKLLSPIFPKIHTVGPIHSLLNSHCGPWEEDAGCLRWLDSRPARSVVFVSFGSLVKMTAAQLREFWYGLVNSGKPFLFVLRRDVVSGGDGRSAVREIVETETEGRGMVVGWAPQEEVLAHKAVGGFLTHSGWNSTLESIAAGVPMISWPNIADQFSNCTWACKVWGVGLEMEAQYDRATVEAMVRSLMGGEEGERMRRSVTELAKRAKGRVGKEGRSCGNLGILIEEIKKLKPSERKRCNTNNGVLAKGN